MPLDLGSLSFETFCSTYWRRQPLYVPGGARRVLDTTFEPSQFLAACERLETVAPGQLVRKGPELAFAPRVDRADETLRHVCERFAGWVSGAQISFDGVYARCGMDIGSRFDRADTFLLQQRGTKRWRLHPPSFLPEDTIRRRLLNETEIDAMYMPDGALEFRLHEGDLLYLPLLWVHWGVSQGESLSLALSFTARLGLDCLELEGSAFERTRSSLWRTCYPQPNPTHVPALRPLPPNVRATLAHDPRWWRPLPTIWTLEGQGAVEAATRAQAERHVNALAASLPELAKVWEAPAGRPSAGRVTGSGRFLAAPPVRDESSVLLGIDELMGTVAALPEPKVELARLAVPEQAFDEVARLRARVARRSMAIFLQIVRQSHALLQREDLRAALRTLTGALTRMPPARCAEALRHVALRSWSWRAAEAIQFGYGPRLEAIVAQLPRLLLPALLDADALAPGDSLPIRPGAARSLQLLGWGVELRVGRALGEVLEARREPHALALTGPNTALRLEPDGPGRPWRPAEGRFEALAPAWPGGPPICGDDVWLHGFFPVSARARGLTLLRVGGPEGRDALAELADVLSAGHAWLTRKLPAWAPRVAHAFELVALREDTADEPPWQSNRGFPGLLATTMRDPEATAHSLAREAARRLAHDALDGLSLIEETPWETFLAWGGRGASLSERVADLLASTLVLDVVPGGAEKGPSARSELATAAEEIGATAGLTEAGAALIDGLVQRLRER